MKGIIDMARPKTNKDYVICDRIKEARKNAGLTQKELAEKLGIPLQTYKNWEQKRNIPKQTDVKEIAIICDVDMSWLMHIDIESIIEESRKILQKITPYNCQVIRPIGIKEEAKMKCILEALTMCGYKWDEITNQDDFIEFMESPMESIKNSIELYMKTINPTKRKDE